MIDLFYYEDYEDRDFSMGLIDPSSFLRTYTTLMPQPPEYDLYGDGHVNFNDAKIILDACNFNKIIIDEGVNDKCDINGDGYIDIDDLTLLIDNNYYGKEV